MVLASEITLLGHMLDRLSEKNRHYRDFTLDQLTAALRETIACFPVYRTYVEPDRPVRDEDRLIILKTLRKARARNPSIDKPVFDFLGKVLLLDLPTNLTEEERDQHVRFTLKFQQCSGPIMAKGLEDTTFYNFNRLVALNEVGGDPGTFGLSPASFHARCVERLRRCPHTLLTTATHDTKRGEDARTRIAAISELAVDWRRSVRRWAEENARFQASVDGQMAPSPNEEYLLYQTLLGVWPNTPLTPEARPEFIERIQQYMIKALKEAKVNSSWVEPNTEWENAMMEFVAAILDPEKGKKFLRSFEPFAGRIAEIGAINSLSQTVLKCCAPGVPDFYQGCELWDLNLVDPDNRRPVDYALRERLLDSVSESSPEELLADWRSGRVKLFTVHRMLTLRSEQEELFQCGGYRPLTIEGVHAQRAVAFLRQHEGKSVAVVAPRLAGTLGVPPLGKAWKSTHLELPEGQWRDVFTGEELMSTGNVPMGNVFARFPIACLVR
jgi:(1->4)-alpha-D-glucan 1-alpha-D-glucosylmutase